MKSLIAALFLLAAATANAQTITPGAGPITPLFVNGASSGNGADTTEDILTTCSYTLPANTLVNVGDRLRVFAAGTAIGSTDSKTVRLRYTTGAGGILASLLLATTVGTTWSQETDIVKTGSSTQTIGNLGAVLNASGVSGRTTNTMTDTSAITLYFTGVDATIATANVVTCGYMSVDFISAPSS